jgi:hypothetical protein
MLARQSRIARDENPHAQPSVMPRMQVIDDDERRSLATEWWRGWDSLTDGRLESVG